MEGSHVLFKKMSTVKRRDWKGQDRISLGEIKKHNDEEAQLGQQVTTQLPLLTPILLGHCIQATTALSLSNHCS